MHLNAKASGHFYQQQSRAVRFNPCLACIPSTHATFMPSVVSQMNTAYVRLRCEKVFVRTFLQVQTAVLKRKPGKKCGRALESPEHATAPEAVHKKSKFHALRTSNDPPVPLQDTIQTSLTELCFGHGPLGRAYRPEPPSPR